MSEFLIGDRVRVRKLHLSELEILNNAVARYPVGTEATIMEICPYEEGTVVGIQKDPGDPIWYYYTYELSHEFDTKGEKIRQSNEALAKFIEGYLLADDYTYPIFEGKSVLDWLNSAY